MRKIKNDQDFKGVVEEILNIRGYHNIIKYLIMIMIFLNYQNKKSIVLLRDKIYILNQLIILVLVQMWKK